MRRAFSLIELSIVLIIIGLLIAAVQVAGKLTSISRAQKIIADIDLFQSVFNGFKLQYDALPGDMPDASSYLDGASDGDGNLRVEESSEEDHYALQHLRLAEFIDGAYDGSTGTWVAGLNVYDSGINNIIYQIAYNADIFDRAGNSINITGLNPNESAVLTAARTKSIDDKIDDGTPKSKMAALQGDGQTAGTHCTSHALTEPSTTDVTYILDTNIDVKTCRIYYFLDDER